MTILIASVIQLTGFISNINGLLSWKLHILSSTLKINFTRSYKDLPKCIREDVDDI